MITFIVGKIPGEVAEIVYDGDVLSIVEAIKLGAEKLHFTYNVTDIIYLNGDIASPGEEVSDNDVVLVDIPKIKGAQKVVEIGRAGSVIKRVAIHNDATVNDALRAAKMPILGEGEVVYIDGNRAIDIDLFSDGSIILIKRDSIFSGEKAASGYNIYDAINSLNKRISAIEEELHS